jgi:hypothetical protein
LGIELLPVLDSSYALWAWDKSNGSASQADVARAYTAITTQGQCSDFSRYVWNDLVNKVADVLDKCGLEWDSTYCSAQAACIDRQYGELTAVKFNSVTRNIHRLGFITWKWAVEKKAGYVGRNYFYGYSTYKERADTLYGWYFIELVDKFNRAIEVLKNEANFSPFTTTSLSETSTNTILGAPKVEAITAPIEARSLISAPMGVRIVRSVEGAILNETLTDSRLLYLPGGLLSAGTLSKSQVNAPAMRLKVEAAVGEILAETIPRTTLTPLVFVGYMGYVKPILSYHQAELEINNIIYTGGSAVSYDYPTGAIYIARPDYMTGAGKSISYENAESVVLPPILMDGQTYEQSFHAEELEKRLGSPMAGHTAEYSVNRASLHGFFPLYIHRAIRSDSYSVAESVYGMSAPMDKKEKSFSAYMGEMISREVAPMAFIEESKSGYTGTAIAILPKFIEGGDDSYSQGLGELTTGKIIYQEAGVKEVSHGLGEIVTPDKALIEARAKAESKTKLTLVASPNGFPLGVAEEIHSATAVDIESTPAEALCNAVSGVSKVHATIENYVNPSTWIDPVYNNGDLYIRQAYDAVQFDGDLRIS